MGAFSVHPRLVEDCHPLGRLPAAHLFLHRNAAVPWFILVPETELEDLLDLPLAQRDAVLGDCKQIADLLRGRFACPKVNVAWIGNLVPQLHVHVIGRTPGDPCWPKPVWGHLAVARGYGTDEVDQIRREIFGG